MQEDLGRTRLDIALWYGVQYIQLVYSICGKTSERLAATDGAYIFIPSETTFSYFLISMF